MLTFGSLFSGAGGFDLGFTRAGMHCAWQVEIDDVCRRILEKHWPAVRRWGDVRTFHPAASDRVDVICGGPPCQPFSSASRGRKRGTGDDRHLWPEMFRVVSQLEPTWVVVENVTQFDGAGLEEVVSDLEGCGYEVAPPLEIPACAFGHDHWRPRLWILGYADRHGEPRLPIDAEVAGMPGSDCDAGRMGETDGVSSRMVRLAAIGNAVVPDIAEWLGRAIVAA